MKKNLIMLLIIVVACFTFACGTNQEQQEIVTPVYTIEIEGKDIVIDENTTYQFSALSNGTIEWSISGDSFGSKISENGLFTAGVSAGVVTIKATVKENTEIYATKKVTIVKKLFQASATALGTAHNNILQVKSFKTTFRIYFKVREYGEFNYSFYYDNILDSTWWYNADINKSYANTKGCKFKILGASFADGGKYANGSVVQSTSVPITFAGQLTKRVDKGEEFKSDSVKVNIPQGNYLAFTWTIEVNSDTAPTIPYTESTFASCFKKDGEYVAQENNEGFSLSNSLFGENVLVAPNKIIYEREKVKNLVFVGDSITQGVSTMRDTYDFWLAKVAALLPTTHSVWNLGSGYATLGNLATKQAWLKKAINADELFICLGVNDLGGNITLNEFKKLLDDTIKFVKSKNSDCIITLFTIPPFNYSGVKEKNWHEINAWIRQKNIKGVDKYFEFAGLLSKDFPIENEINPEFMSTTADPHPNGYAGTKIAMNFINWYNNPNTAIKNTFDNYINIYQGDKLILPTALPVKTEGGFIDYKDVTWNKDIDTSTAGVFTYIASFGNDKKAIYTIRIKEKLNSDENNKEYFVICGNILKSQNEAKSNSVYDKAFGVDEITGKQWGYDENVTTTVFWENYPQWQAIRCSNNAHNEMVYKFALDEGNYNISLGFQDPWSVVRTMTLAIDGEVRQTALSTSGATQLIKQYAINVEQSHIVNISLKENSPQPSAINWIEIEKISDKVPLENDIISVKNGDGYAVIAWNDAKGALEYEISYGEESGVYTKILTQTKLTQVIKGLTNGKKYYCTVRGKNDTGFGKYSNEVVLLPKGIRAENVIYNIDCGSIGIVPLKSHLGKNNSVEDKTYGIDEVTGYNWGYTIDGGVWGSGNPLQNHSVLVAILAPQDFEGKGIHYKFGLENGDYEVQIVLFDYWKHSARVQDVVINGKVELKNYVTQCGGPETFIYNTKVNSENLTIDILGGKGNIDNIVVSSIKIIKK